MNKYQLPTWIEQDNQLDQSTTNFSNIISNLIASEVEKRLRLLMGVNTAATIERLMKDVDALSKENKLFTKKLTRAIEALDNVAFLETKEMGLLVYWYDGSTHLECAETLVADTMGAREALRDIEAIGS